MEGTTKEEGHGSERKRWRERERNIKWVREDERERKKKRERGRCISFVQFHCPESTIRAFSGPASTDRTLLFYALWLFLSSSSSPSSCFLSPSAHSVFSADMLTQMADVMWISRTSLTLPTQRRRQDRRTASVSCPDLRKMRRWGDVQPEGNALLYSHFWLKPYFKWGGTRGIHSKWIYCSGYGDILFYMWQYQYKQTNWAVKLHSLCQSVKNVNMFFFYSSIGTFKVLFCCVFNLAHLSVKMQ